ncbi:TIR domain-containing protein [Desulfosarcina sp. OttesenSCG-928-A07]|nr:TIR domain-containing protein [Desulfosarcina sp. OttesenSCG-928-G17]MDL2328852.1 TIR domain-containing protein [Desulfosarcina sp. OttesenSCG-928-A07]
MSTKYKPPLAIHFIWHPADESSVEAILDFVRSCFARDVNCPFSRGLNIPLFFYSSENPCRQPLHSPRQCAAKDIVFVFTSTKTLGYDEWKSYINNLSLSDTLRAVPIAIDKHGLGHGDSGALEKLNFLRAYEWVGDSREQRAVLAMAHEICRYGFVEISGANHGKRSSIKIFLSHAKAGDTGRLHAESIYKFVDATNMSRFFDATDISSGFKFDEEIAIHIQESTLVAIGSDAYSSRYWCQREILYAKENDRPIIAVDCLQEYQDRIFPAGANVPCVHVSHEASLSESDILRILVATILETIRYYHAKESLKYYQDQKWIPKNCTILSRPPEVHTIVELKKNAKKKICYPEPPIYSEEADWLSYFGVDAFTPLWNPSDRDALKDFRIGISISDIPAEGYANHHLHANQLKRLSQDLARHLLARSGILIYGGDLRKDGFTEFILDEAMVLKERIKTDNIHVENHLAWPIYVFDLQMVEWRAKYSNIIKPIEHDIPIDISKEVIDKNTPIPPTCIENKYIWSRCLTQMREESIKSSQARICAGGKLAGYNGKMPGVLEEIIISIDNKKPLYLLGAFGGVVGEVCKTILKKSLAEPLTEKWQCTYNTGYGDLQKMAKQKNENADYAKIKTMLEHLTCKKLAKLSGLGVDDYKRLMESPFVDECVHLILKGLKKVASNSSI